MIVIENLKKDASSLSGSSRPDTPASIRNNEIIANTETVESGSSQEDDFNMVKAYLGDEEFGDDVMPHVAGHVAKYDFAGSTDIELDFTKGSVIKVIEKSDNGWWKGVYMGQVGWFPESYVSATALRQTSKEVRERAESAGSVADGEVERPRNMDEMMGVAGKLKSQIFFVYVGYSVTPYADKTN